MLETIIKRDGTEQPFEASKLNKWAIWTARHVTERVDWSSIVLSVIKTIGVKATSSDLNASLIRQLIRKKRWPEQLMAGGLYASDSRKEIYGPDGLPTIQQLHQRLTSINLMDTLKYSDADYAAVEKIIRHDRDYEMAYFQIKQLRKKYAIRNEVKGIEYETPQFIFMRMAMALAENNTTNRLGLITDLYNDFSNMYVNAPTPNYVNLGTQLKGFASCCLYSVDDNIGSLAAGDYIGYRMTAISAGIGNILMTRSIGDPIRGGKISHAGKFPYLRSQTGAVTANKQAGRSGADNSYISVYDPEIQDLIMMQNPRTPVDKRNRNIHLTLEHNKQLAKKLALDEDVFYFNKYTAPDLYEAQFSGDTNAFEELYSKYENDPTFEKTYISARDIVRNFRQQMNEVSTIYGFQIDEANRHTPHKDPIYSSNLCVEITQPTLPYQSVVDLHYDGDLSYSLFETYSTFGSKEIKFKGETEYYIMRNGERKLLRGCYLKEGDVVNYAFSDNTTPVDVTLTKFVKYQRNPEVSTCSLGGVVISNIDIPSRSKEEIDAIYEKSCYNNLVMIDECIHKSDFPLEHVKWTSLQRLNAGIGILGLAHHMARKNLKWNTPEGLAEIDRVFERHAYFCIKASLKLGKERGNAPWMHRTKWPEGWLPIDTYKKTVDELVPFETRYDWETLRAEIIANGGIRNSSLMAMMPTESSSKASGAPNGPYPIRDLDLAKSDSSNLLEWCAPDNDILADQYQLAWETTTIEQIKYYAVMQKWIDQSISADRYRDRTKTMLDENTGQQVPIPITDDELFQEQLAVVYYGVKSEYYMNSFTGGKAFEHKETPQAVEEAVEEVETNAPGCDGGFCTL